MRNTHETLRGWTYGLAGLALSAGAQMAVAMDDGNVSAPEDGIIDFSFAGYQASEKPIPFVRVVETLDPLPGEAAPEGTMAYPQGPDSHARIQAALDRAAALEPDENGFRGTVFLSKGTYYVNGGLHLKSGVVLRGEGERDFGTALIFRNPQGAGITMGSEQGRIENDGSFSGIHSQMGVEGLALISNYDTAITTEAGSTDGPYAADEESNLKNSIEILNAENVWVRGCRMLHSSQSAVLMTDSRYVTVRDCNLLEPVPAIREGRSAFYSNNGSSMILVYNCNNEEGRQDFVTLDGHLQSADTSVEAASLFERQLAERIGERQAYRVLAQTLSKASLNTEILFPRPVVDGVIQGEITPAQTAFEEADRREWKTVMSDDGTGDWTEQWFLDGEGTSTVTNSPEGMELKALDSHMVLWTNESFEGDVKIEYEFTRTDPYQGGVIIIYIQATGDGAEGFDPDITKWNDFREDANMGHYFSNMHVYHVSYACGYVRGRRYMPDLGKMNTFTELTPEYLVDQEDLFELGVTYKVTFIKTDRAIRMRAVGPEKALYFMLDNEKWPEITEGRIGLRQMQGRWSRYKDFKVSVPGE